MVVINSVLAFLAFLGIGVSFWLGRQQLDFAQETASSTANDTQAALSTSERAANASIAIAEATKQQAFATRSNAKASESAARASAESAKSLTDSVRLAQASLRDQRAGYVVMNVTGVSGLDLGKNPQAAVSITAVGGPAPIRVRIGYLYDLAPFEEPPPRWNFRADEIVLSVAPGQTIPRTFTGLRLDENQVRALSQYRAKFRVLLRADYIDANKELKSAYLCHEWTGAGGNIWPHYCATPTEPAPQPVGGRSPW
jgi:hypothetical protein